MEDVVLHYLPRSNARLNSQLEATEKLLKPFPCRPPPVFTPWFSDSHRPIRPAKSAPVISSFDPSYTPTASHSAGIASIVQKPLERLFSDRLQQDPKVFVSGTKENIVPPVLENTRAPSHKCKQGFSVKATPSLRSWSVFTHRGVLLKRSQPLSKGFCHVVSVLKLHLCQRVRWVISQHNCAGDIEQVWRAVSGLVQASQLPTCNANIQRERAEIWVFCDVVHSEQVGHCLKDKLQLSGKICLTVRRRGSILSI